MYEEKLSGVGFHAPFAQFILPCIVKKKEEKAYLLVDNYRERVSCREYLPSKLVVDFLAQLNQECEEKNNM